MKLTKKLVSIVLAAIMVIGTCAVSVSAASIYETAVALPSGKQQSFTLSSWGDSKDYKIVLSQKETLTISMNVSIFEAYLYLYDADGNTINPNEYKFTSGEGSIKSDHLYCKWNKTTENFKGTVKYELKKGTYYIRLLSRSSSGSGKTTFKATYDSGNTSSSSGKISYLTLQMEVGDTIRLGAVAEPTDAEITWTSSKTAVATVSASGKVTAKKEGSTIITAKTGSSTQKIKIVVV